MTLSLLANAPAAARDLWIGPMPPTHIWPGVMVQRWLNLAYVHWPMETTTVQALLPPGLTVDTFDGSAWVSLIPFTLELRLPGTPTLPYMSRFLEANVRTYVRGPDGERGIWFLSLDAARLGPVLVARRDWRLPYMWADMQTDRVGQVLRARSTRRWPDREAHFDLELEHGVPKPVGELDERTQFLACRWRLYSVAGSELPQTEIRFDVSVVDHPEWRIAPARIRRLDSTMLEACGLPTPTAEPFANYSPGVSTRFARRARCS